jgi:hypothetical protein
MGFLDEVRQETGRVYRRRIDEIKGLLSERGLHRLHGSISEPTD